MKITNIFAIAFFLVAVSCNKENSPLATGKNDNGQEEIYKGAVHKVFTAASAETKTAIGELEGSSRAISWVEKDKIDIFFNDRKTVAEAASSGASTTFAADVDEAENYYAVYPSGAASYTDGSLTVTIPSTQDVSKGFGAAHYAAALAVGDNFAFRHLCGWLKFTISDPSVKRVLIRGNGEQPITGKVSVTFNEDGTVASTAVSSGNSRLIVDVDGTGDYYVAVLPGMELANGVGFRFYTEHDLTSAVKTGVFSGKPLEVAEAGRIVNLGDINSRIVIDWYISPEGSGTKDGLTAENAAEGVAFLRSRLAQDETSDATKNGIAKGYGCIGVRIHAAAGEYDFAGGEIKIAWPGHTSPVGTEIIGVQGGTIFKNTGKSRFFDIGKSVDLKLDGITLTGGSVDGNGGAVDLSDATASLRLANCVFDGNKAHTGGAVYLAGKSIEAENTVFINNTAATAAGAVGVTGTATDVIFTDCDFISNTAGRHGGAFQNYGGNNTVISISCGTFRDNKTTDATAGGGGAVTCRGTNTTMSIDGVTFAGNSGWQGGAVRVATANEIRINNCEITGNSSNVYAGGIYIGANANLYMNACSVYGNSNTTAITSNGWGPAVFVASAAAEANVCFNNSTFGDHTTVITLNDTNIDIQGGNLVFANSTMIASTAAGMLRVHTGGGNAAFINSIVVNKNGNSINYNSTSGKLTSSYVISGTAQNKYRPAADIDKADVSYADLGSPSFDAADGVYKWDGTLAGCPAAPEAAIAEELIKTANAGFHAWLVSINALDVDQLGNSRASNRQGAWCGN